MSGSRPIAGCDGSDNELQIRSEGQYQVDGYSALEVRRPARTAPARGIARRRASWILSQNTLGSNTLGQGARVLANPVELSLQVFVPNHEVKITNVQTHSTATYVAAPTALWQPYYVDRCDFPTPPPRRPHGRARRKR
jgi:hypothetical protein